MSRDLIHALVADALFAAALIALALRTHRPQWDALRRELRGVFPVYSAQSVRGREAELIRDRLPRRLRFGMTLLLLVIAAGALAWGLAR